MKLVLTLFISMFFFGNIWENDFNVAQKKAADSKKYILLNFSGSDWCGPCIRMHKEIFEANDFQKYASENLVLLRADFPRLKKNQLPAEQLKKNNDLALKYNPDGVFPLTLLLDEQGKVVKKWDGFPQANAQEFTAQIDKTQHAKN
ncbi:thioredoxin family protein [Pedobacter puniceum]|jgi:thioredoxin-related protein|uniref:Thioredoxin fold domain-containing protein n=1 Tax=Pedobacter puniceum TaxID=2666136 RepID=A0A7K0FR37_9SPHI|nr:thioredoxin family protein [Pedobacter puniceum]MRX47770.1 thioredoxin fold domain-containing protein [Pedobacter puniceum]